MKSERFSSHAIGSIGAGTGSISVRHFSSYGSMTEKEIQEMLNTFPVTQRQKRVSARRKPGGKHYKKFAITLIKTNSTPKCCCKSAVS